MGRSHALAYHNNPGFEIVGLVNRSTAELPEELAGYAIHPRLRDGACRAEARSRSINTYSDSHADYAVDGDGGGRRCLRRKAAGNDGGRCRARRRRRQGKRARSWSIGYILRHHPSWMRLIAEARKLGGPYVFRMNLNQQSARPDLGDAQAADADDLADRRLRRALSRRDVPDHRRQGRSRCAAWACGSPTRSRRTCTITAICRCCSRTARSAGTRPAGGR